MDKFLLTIEFRYHVVPKYDSDLYDKSDVVTIGVYDSFDEAIDNGNEVLKMLSDNFKFYGSKFGKNNGPFGSPTMLVCSAFKYPEVFCKITKLKYFDIKQTMNNALNSEKEYREWENDLNTLK